MAAVRVGFARVKAEAGDTTWAGSIISAGPRQSSLLKVKVKGVDQVEVVIKPKQVVLSLPFEGMTHDQVKALLKQMEGIGPTNP